MLVTCLLVITFIMLVVSAYRQYRTSSEAALLTDATSSVASHLAVDELAYVNPAGETSVYIIDPAKLSSLTDFKRGIGGENYEFQISLFYESSEEHVLGPYGAAPPEGRPNCTLEVAAAVFENNHPLPAKLKVVAWHA